MRSFLATLQHGLPVHSAVAFIQLLCQQTVPMHTLLVQTKALQHALTLPKLERLVYSTCSTHEMENELVVKAVLPDAQALGFQLADPFPGWPRRGLPLLPGHQRLIRVGKTLRLMSLL